MIAAAAARTSAPQVVPPAAGDAAPGFDALLDAAQPPAAASAPAPAAETAPPPAAEPDWQAHVAALAPQPAPAPPGAPQPPAATPPTDPAPPEAVLLRRQEPSGGPLPTEALPAEADPATGDDARADDHTADAAAATASAQAPVPTALGAPIAAGVAPASAPRDAKPSRAHERRPVTATGAAPAEGASHQPPAPAATPPAVPAATLAPDAPAPASAPAAPDARLLAHQLGTAHDAAQLDRLAREIATAADGDARVRFALAPATLGHVEIELQRGDDGTAVRISTASHASHAAIADARPQLVAEAQAQGVRISRAHVELTDAGDARGDRGAGGGASPDDRRHAPRAPAPDRAPPRAPAPANPVRDPRDLYA